MDSQCPGPLVGVPQVTGLLHPSTPSPMILASVLVPALHMPCLVVAARDRGCSREPAHGLGSKDDLALACQKGMPSVFFTSTEYPPRL